MPGLTRPTRPQQWVMIDDVPIEPITRLMPAHSQVHEMAHADGGGWQLDTSFAQANEDEHFDADWHNAEETFDFVTHNAEETPDVDSHNNEETPEHDSVRPHSIGGQGFRNEYAIAEHFVALTLTSSERTAPVRLPSPQPAPESVATGQHPHSTLQHEHEQLSHRYAILLESYHRVLGERQQAAEQNPQHDETIKDLEETIRDINEDVDRLEREREGKNQEIQDLRSAYAVVHSRACHLESKNAELSAENEQLKARLAAKEEAEWLHQQASRGPVPPLRRAKRAKATRRDSSESNSSSNSSGSSAPEMTSSGSSSSSGESSNSAPAFMRRRANYTGLAMPIPAIYARTHTSPSSTIRTESSFVDLPPSFVSSMDAIDLGPSYPFTDTAANTISKFGRGVNDMDLGPSYDFTTTATATAVRPASSHHASRPANSVDDIDLGPTSPDSPPATTTTAEGQNFIILNDNTNGVRIDRTRSRSVSDGGFVDVSPDEMAASDNQSLASGEGWRITEPAPLVTTTVEVSVDRA